MGNQTTKGWEQLDKLRNLCATAALEGAGKTLKIVLMPPSTFWNFDLLGLSCLNHAHFIAETCPLDGPLPYGFQ